MPWLAALRVMRPGSWRSGKRLAAPLELTRRSTYGYVVTSPTQFFAAASEKSAVWTPTAPMTLDSSARTRVAEPFFMFMLAKFENNEPFVIVVDPATHRTPNTASFALVVAPNVMIEGDELAVPLEEAVPLWSFKVRPVQSSAIAPHDKPLLTDTVIVSPGESGVMTFARTMAAVDLPAAVFWATTSTL
jgi:hypothetical protein